VANAAFTIVCRRVAARALAVVAWAGAAAAQVGPPDAAPAHPVFQNASPRILQGAKRMAEREPVAANDTGEGVLQTGDLASWPRLWRNDDLLISGTLTGTLGMFRMWNNAFGLPASLNPTSRRNDPGWAEFFLEPGLMASYTLDGATKLYGGASYMETGTRGTDYNAVGNTWHGAPELLYAGIRWQDAARQLAFDASYGQQDFAVGNNLLLAAGASNGAQLGADYIGPRSAWANAALLKATWRDLTVQGFWLKPNDAPSAATGTRLAGVNAQWGDSGPLQLAFMYLRALESAIVTRDGLDVYDVRATIKPWGADSGWMLRAEYAWERKDGVTADGWYVEGSYHAAKAMWRPLVTLRYASFSGDRPDTATWEGFDPLYFGGSNPDWYQGKLMSTLVNNTNLDSVAASLSLAPDARSIVQLVFLQFAAARTDSPLAIPAAGQPVTTGGGVPSRSLATEIDAVYTYTFSKQVNINVFAGYATPGTGYKQLYSASGGSAQPWWIVGTQFNISY
jgi:hypothetical protein